MRHRNHRRSTIALALVSGLATAVVSAGTANAAASWAHPTPGAASWAAPTPNAASWAAPTPNAASWAAPTPNAASWAAPTPNAASWAHPTPGAASWAGASRATGLLRAVVALRDGHAVGGPGVTVVTTLPAVHAEVVAGTARAIGHLVTRPGVLGVMPDQAMRLDGNAFDPGAGSVLAPASVGGRAGNGDAGRGVTVALVDTGVSDTPALNRASGRLVDAVDTSPLTRLERPMTSGAFTDGYGHGTFMASLIAGGAADGRHGPVIGVAPGATVDVVKVADADGTTSLASVLAGLNWVADHANSVQVANLALGLPTHGGWGLDPLTLATDLVRRAGVTVVAAAGNTAGEVSDPGFDPHVLTVGAADLTSGPASVAPFSGSGVIAGVTKPDVVAAGVGILGLLPADSVIAHDYPNALQANGLWRGSGTSEATAITSGVAALLIAQRGNLDPALVKASLRAAATSVSGAGGGAGLVQFTARVTDGHRPNDKGTGEEGFSPVAYTTSDWAQASMPATAWAAASWARAASWAAASWAAASWAGSWWDAASWAAASWAAASWAAASWAGTNWDAASWAAASWAAASWAAASWADESWGR